MRGLSISGRTPAVAVGVAVAMVAAGGGAFAASSGSDGTITACAKKHTGTLYVAKRCKKGDRKLSWNEQGPAGAAGSPGATGATGAQGNQGQQGNPGPALPGYITHADGVNFVAGTHSSQTTIATLSLPAGSYLVNAKTEAVAVSSTAPSAEPSVYAQCTLVTGAASDTAAWESPLGLGQDTNSHAAGSLITQEEVTLASAGTATLECFAQWQAAAGDHIFADGASIEAVQITPASD